MKTYSLHLRISDFFLHFYSNVIERSYILLLQKLAKFIRIPRGIWTVLTVNYSNDYQILLHRN